MTERLDIVILGRLLGTADCWENGGDNAFQFMSFIPALEVAKSIPACDTLSCDFDTGEAISYNDEGDIIQTIDLPTLCAGLALYKGPSS